MALVVGSLTEGMQKAAKDGVVAVLIIDQQEPAVPVVNLEVPYLTRAQQRLLGFAASIGCKFWRIELSQNGVGVKPTLIALRAYLPTDAPVISKQKFNGFEGTTLANDLATAGVTHVVLLGHEMNCCVKHTAIGGSYKKNDPFVAGATGHNLQVLTTRDVLSGKGDPSWVAAPKVTFYTTLG